MNRLLLFVLLVMSARAVRAQTTMDTLTAYPNPFENVVHIKFDLLQSDTVTLLLFDVTGQIVVTVFDHTLLPTGLYTIDYDGSALANGLYLLRLVLTSNAYNQRLEKLNNINSVQQAYALSDHVFWPNPTDGSLHTALIGKKKIVVTNLLGQPVKTIFTADTAVGLDNLPSGAFMLTVLDDRNRFLFRQTVVKR